jgi:dihydropteroate synthase
MTERLKSLELVGILNITDNSFSDGGLYLDANEALAHAAAMHKAGANYLDVGAEATGPKARPLLPEQEWLRLEPVLASLSTTYGEHLSIDTYHPETVRRAHRLLGTFIVNDVTSMNSPRMQETVAELGLPCIISHLPEAYGQDIQAAHFDKPVDTIEEVQDDLLSKRAALINRGIAKDQIILDPGIGFGKTADLNWELLSFARKVPDADVMIGYSRKRFLGANRMKLEPNLQAGRVATEAGTKYLRVHDVAGHATLLG